MSNPDSRSQDSAHFHQWLLPDGRVWARFYRLDTHYLVSFPELADFAISHNGDEITTRPASGVASQTVEHLYANQVLPLALSRQLKLVLHAAAIEVGATDRSSAIAFAGISGRGKSTLAASFAAHGFGFLTDDSLQLEKTGSGYQAHPSHPSIRLWDDSRQALLGDNIPTTTPLGCSPKFKLLAGDSVAFCNAPRPLKALYFLGENRVDSVDIRVSHNADTVIELLRHSFLLDLDERQALSLHFGQLMDLVKTVPCYRLDYPRLYTALPDVREAIVRHALSL